MALPTAQLGGMPNINVPSYVPVVPIEKHPKLWQQALTQLLASTGNAVIQKGVENSMSPDFAPQPASGFSKFWNGPTISAQRAGQLDQQVIEQERAKALADQQQAERELKIKEILGNQSYQNRSLDLERGRYDETARHNISDEQLANQEALTSSSHQHLQDLIAQVNMERQGQLAGAQTKHLGAETTQLNAEAEQKVLQARMMKQSLNALARKSGQPVPYPEVEQGMASNVNPNIAKFAESNVGPKVEARLQDTKRYPTAEMILAGQRNAPPSPEAAALGLSTPDIPPQVRAMIQPQSVDTSQFMPQAPVGQPNYGIDQTTGLPAKSAPVSPEDQTLINLLLNAFGSTPLKGQQISR